MAVTKKGKYFKSHLLTNAPMRKLCLLAALAFSLNCEQKTPPPTDPSSLPPTTRVDFEAPVYNYEAATYFEYAKRGIHGEFLNLINYETTPFLEDILYFEEVQKEEREFSIGTLGEKEVALSELAIYLVAIKNLQLLKSADEGKEIELGEKLKGLLVSLEGIDTFPDYQRVEKIYTALGGKVDAGKEGVYLSLVDLLNSKEGNCNSLAPAYFSVLQYLGVETYFRFGKLMKEDGRKYYHVWLSVETELGMIDLDPTWYGDFVPLMERNPKIPRTTLNEEFLLRK